MFFRESQLFTNLPFNYFTYFISKFVTLANSLQTPPNSFEPLFRKFHRAI